MLICLSDRLASVLNVPAIFLELSTLARTDDELSSDQGTSFCFEVSPLMAVSSIWIPLHRMVCVRAVMHRNALKALFA